MDFQGPVRFCTNADVKIKYLPRWGSNLGHQSPQTTTLQMEAPRSLELILEASIERSLDEQIMQHACKRE
jgi:hypothetical protein